MRNRTLGKTRLRWLGIRLAFVVIFAGLGILLLRGGHAATYSTPAEVEGATIGGQAAVVGDTTASGSSAVRFGPAVSSSGNPYLAPTSYKFAPYAYIPWGDIVMADYASTTGVRTLFGAFVQSSGCAPFWDGNSAFGLNSNRSAMIATDITNVRALGGDVAVSFGGASGTELANACSSVAGLQSAYQSVITKYSLKHINFDLEGAGSGSVTAMSRRAQAVYNLQQANPGLKVSLTIPVETTGLSETDGLRTVKAFYTAGVVVSSVGIMAMDFGDFGSGQSSRVISAADAALPQLQEVYVGASAADIAKALNLIVMIGKNDTAETFTLADATTVKNYVVSKGIGTLSMWSAARDQQCGSSPTASVQEDTCSQITQSQYQFAGIFKTAY